MVKIETMAKRTVFTFDVTGGDVNLKINALNPNDGTKISIAVSGAGLNGNVDFDLNQSNLSTFDANEAAMPIGAGSYFVNNVTPNKTLFSGDMVSDFVWLTTGIDTATAGIISFVITYK